MGRRLAVDSRAEIVMEPSVRSREPRNSATSSHVVSSRAGIDHLKEREVTIKDNLQFSQGAVWIGSRSALDVLHADCVWGDWTVKASCSATCGGGFMQQRRTVLLEARNGGRACRGGLEQVVNCNAQACP